MTTMSRRIAFVLLLAACGNPPAPQRAPEPLTPIATAVPLAPIVAPTVTAPGVVAVDESRPPVVVLIDAQGQRSLAAAASWKTLGVWTAGPKPAGVDASSSAVVEGHSSGLDPKTIVDKFTNSLDRPTDDPPPPSGEDEVDEEDGLDESGGTGTAMALDEGKLGRKPSVEPVLPFRGRRGGYGYGFARDPRYATIIGEVTSERLARVPAIVIAQPTTKAAVLIRAVTELEAMIGVRIGSEVRPLRLQFHHDHEHPRQAPPTEWLELQVATSGLAINAKSTDLGTLGPMLAAIRQQMKLAASVTIDVLVGADVDAQRLVDVLVALDGAGVTSIGLGSEPTAERRRADLPPVVSTGQPNAIGDLDKAIIRRSIRKNIQKIQYCYEKELLAKPTLAGTVIVQFFIAPSGKVKSSTGSGVDAELARCVATMIKGIEFPKPKGGGGVQVNYPFTFRPEGVKK